MKNKTVHEALLYACDKKISESMEHERVLNIAINALETVKHRKNIDAHGTKAIKNAGVSAHIYNEYTPRITLYCNNRIYSTSEPDTNGCSIADYYENTDVTIYFDLNAGYAGIIENMHKRITGLLEYRVVLEKEKENADTIIAEYYALEKARKAYENYTYITRDAIANY
jgi:hypothetical protein